MNYGPNLKSHFKSNQFPSLVFPCYGGWAQNARWFLGQTLNLFVWMGMEFPTMRKPLRTKPKVQWKVLKPTLSYFPLCICFPRRPKLYWAETFSPSLVVPHSSLMYLSPKNALPYSLAHFPFYNAFLVGSEWWCFIHLVTWTPLLFKILDQARPFKDSLETYT